MVKIMQKNEDGTESEIEALTPAEVEAKLAAEKAALEGTHTAVITEKDTKITTLAQEKKDLEQKIAKMELDGIKDDHPNFKILKEALQKKDTDIEGLKKEIETDRTTRRKEAWDNKIKLAAKGNDEFEKKIRLHLDKTLASLPETTPEEQQTKFEAALKLSSDGSAGGPGMFDHGTGGGGFGGGGEGGKPTVEFTGREKALGAKFGISEADYKKYGPKLTNKPRQ